MNAIKEFPAINPNPILNVLKDGTVINSNEAGEPLLFEWGVKIGGKLPSNIVYLVQDVISRNSPEKIEVNVGNKVYLVVFSPLPAHDCVSISGFDISDQKCLEKRIQGNEDQRIADVELAEIIDAQAIQSLMDDFYKLSHIPMSLDDLKGNILVGVGWQDICTKFHRVNSKACTNCIESDTKLSAGVPPGEFKLYKCKNNMWDIATPIFVCDWHVGNIFSGQFFFDNEPLDYELFRSQARKYGFNEKEYIAALEKVPRLSRKAVDAGMSFFIKLANLISKLSYSNTRLAQSLSEREVLLETLRMSEEKYRAIFKNSIDAIFITSPDGAIHAANPAACHMFGMTEEEIIQAGRDGITDASDPRLKSFIEKRARNGKARGEHNHRRKDGTIFPGEVSSGFFKDKNGVIRTVTMIRDITESKRAEEALRESKEKFRGLVEHVNDWVWEIDMDCFYTYSSPRVRDMLGYEPADLLGTTPFNYMDSEETDRVKSLFYPILNAREEFSLLEHTLIRKDGCKVTVETSGMPIYDIQGNFSGYRGIDRDISARKRVEEALKNAYDDLEEKVKERTAELEKAYELLKESEGRLKALFNILPVGVSITDNGRNIIDANPTLEKILCLSRSDLLNGKYEARKYIRSDGTEMPPKELPSVKALENKGTIKNAKLGIIIEDGSTIWTDVSAIALPFSNGQVVITTRDITESKKAEEKIKESEEKYRTIVETTNEGIIVCDSNFKATYVNNKMADMLGYCPEEIIGKTALDFTDEESAIAVKLKQDIICWHGITEVFEFKFKRKNGSVLWTLVNSKINFDKEGNFTGSLSMFTDITERKKAAESLANYELSRKKEMHHRIKNNLQVISSLLDLQADTFKGKKEIKILEVLQAFRESQDRVLSMALIHEELQNSGGMSTINISQYIDDLADNLFLTYRLGNENTTFTKKIGDDIFFDMDTTVPLGLIINELISNSFKYAFLGRDNGEILVTLCKNESGINYIENSNTAYVLSVSDNGIGIPEDLDIGNLNSLGLQLVTTLVDQIDGELELRRDNGTKFTIRFMVTENNNSVSVPITQ
jgi:PAS domain S-box-containing protein